MHRIAELGQSLCRLYLEVYSVMCDGIYCCVYRIEALGLNLYLAQVRGKEIM